MGLLWVGGAGAQTTVCALDAVSGKPIEYIHLLFEEQGGRRWLQVGGIEGCSPNQLERPARVTATFVGYTSASDSIGPGRSLTLRLAPSSQDLDPVVITAQFGPTKAAESLQNVRIINAERLQERGAATLDQALNDQLNIRLTNDGVFGSSVSLQGLSGEHVKILVDGVPVLGRLDGQIDLSQIPVSSIERIEIIEGPMSVSYGSNALAGVINIITKKSQGTNPEASVEGLYESFGQTNLNARIAAPMPGYRDLQTQLILGRNFFDGWSAVDTGQRSMDWNQKEQWYADAALTHPLGKGSLSARMQWNQELVKDKGERRSPYSDYAFDTWFGTRRATGSLNYAALLNARDRLEVLVSYSDFLRTNTLYNRNLVEGWQEISPEVTAQDTNRAAQWLSRGTYSRNPGTSADTTQGWAWQLGYEVSSERASGDRIEGGTRNIDDLAAFGSVRWAMGRGWTVQPGVRVAYNSAFASQPVPSIHLKWNARKNLAFRANYARGFRAPSLKELYLEFVDANHNLYGNPELQPEVGHHAEVGMDWSHSGDGVHRFSLKPLVFFNRVYEQIELAQIDPVRFSYVNLASTLSAGGRIEAGYEIHPDFGFRLGAALTYQDFDAGEGQTRSFVSPEYSAGFDYWRPSKRFGFQATYRYQGETPLVGLGATGVELGRLEDYHYLECSATEKFWKGKVQWTVGVRNLLDVQSLSISNATGGVHSAGTSRPQFRGRSVFTSLRLTL